MFAKRFTQWGSQLRQFRQSVKERTAFIDSFVTLRYGRRFVESVIFTETAIGLHYYWKGDCSNDSYELRSTERYGTLRVIPIEHAWDGSFLIAPVWRSEVGTLKVDTTSPPGTSAEFVMLHEAGHSLLPQRPILSSIYLVNRLVSSSPLALLITWTGVGLWKSLSEKFADYHALTHCSYSALQSAWQRCHTAALTEQNFFFIPRDPHFSNSQRAHLMRARMTQLEINPDTAPCDLPLPPLNINVLDMLNLKLDLHSFFKHGKLYGLSFKSIPTAY